ncbi:MULTISPECIES: hypothetical protein [unclassified Frondihabitans]|uniref:hypothetical protein n=1 Tax=unclassified Frondihabitans TaxID=2626248 RepID=UPI000F4DA442|nr:MULTISPECIES: hypothetical protein [unclassified Frondihabitans]
MTGSAPTPDSFTMLGSADAAACEGDSCLIPGALTETVTMPEIEPTADEAAAASARAVTAALDEGASL